MAIQFYKLKVKKLIRETAEAVSVVFEIPSELKSTFAYKHGQYLTLRFNVDGHDARRAYSASTSPFTDEDIAVTVKKVDDGLVSRYINDKLKVDDVIDVMPPLGNFTIDLKSTNSRHYILFGGGSGITPLISIIKSVLSQEPNSTIALYYSNRNVASVIFEEKLKELEANSNGKLTISYSLDAATDNFNGHIGYVTAEIYTAWIDKVIDKSKENQFFMCGPAGMMNIAEQALDNYKIEKKFIHKESFTVDLKPQSEIQKNYTGSLKTQNVDVNIYGSKHSITVQPDETILVAGMRANLDPPFSCQIGACSTCRAKLISGSVYMEAFDALTDDEMEEGYILTCMSHPTSEGVVVDYDE